MRKPRVSVIIPVYNVEAYIRECISSILNQTLDSIEIIIVNDGATDNSIKVIEDLINLHNIILINQENKGLSAARNTGLKNATGDYVAFIDSDDYLEPDFLEILYLEAIKENLDIVVGGYKKLFSNETLVEIRRKGVISSEIMSGTTYLHKCLSLSDYYVEVCDDLYKRAFLEENNLWFYEGILYEDEEFTPRCFIKAKRVKKVDCAGYVYRQREGSITSSTVGLKELSSLLIVIENLLKVFINETEERAKLSVSRLIRVLVYKYEKILWDLDVDNKEELLLNLVNKKVRKTMNYRIELNYKINIRYFILENLPFIYFGIKYLKCKLINIK